MKKMVCLLFFPLLLWAANNPPDFRPNTVPDNVGEKTEQWEKPALQQSAAIHSSNQGKAVNLDAKTLLANPALLKRAMHSVVLTKQIDGLRVVLPIYRQLPDADALLITYAESLLAHSQGKLKTAINGYRQVIAKAPQLSIARLDLATALYANRQSAAARDQLVRLQSETLPDDVAQFVKQTLENIDHEEDWQFNANAYYRQEDNINNVPKQRKIPFGNGTLTFPKPEKAHGMHLELGTTKRFNFNHNLYSNLQFDAVSDFFWDNHDYDDLSLRAGVGFGYQDSKFTTQIQPFIKKRFYGTEPYSLTRGASGFFSYQLTPRWKLSNVWEWSHEDFKTRKHLNGQRHFIGLSGLYIRNPQQYWSAGINYYNSEAKATEDGYHRLGAFVGWGQEWHHGISTNLTLSAGKRDYDGVDFFNIKRQDKEYNAKLSVWHRGLHYWGITPRLVWSWNKTDSNHFYYDKQENTVNVEFSKSF